MYHFDWGTLTLGRLAFGFYTLILFIMKWHNVYFRIIFPFLPVMGYNNLPDVDIGINTEA